MDMSVRANRKGGFGNVFFISFSQFWVNFSFNFMFAFLPFYINKISSYTPEQTLLWVGVIFGSTSACVAFSGPFWGSLTHRISPKFIYLAGLSAHCLTFGVMAFTTNLPFFLFLRILQGVFGGTATIGLIIISNLDTRQRSRDIGFFQSSITFGQLIGPPLGTLTVTWLGYSMGFLLAGAMVVVTLILCYLFVDDIPHGKNAAHLDQKGGLNTGVIITWLLCLIAQIQLMFLPSILPDVFYAIGLNHDGALHWAGIIITLYTITSMIGVYVWCSLVPRIAANKMITALMIGGIILQGLLIFPHGLFSFSVIRMAQTGLIAAVIPLSLAIYAGKANGFTMGFLYSSRFVGNAIGPIMATTLVAFSNISTLYVSICGLSLMILVVFQILSKKTGTTAVS